MKQSLALHDIDVIPNGTDLSVFYPQDKTLTKQRLKWDMRKVHVLFPSDPERVEKNYQLVLEAIKHLNDEKIEIHNLKNIKVEHVPLYFNASDILVLASLREGSPNVIKEAMACNIPVVSTDVGDVKWIFGETEGCFLTSFDVKEMAFNLKQAIIFSQKVSKTNGRDRIINLGLSSDKIAERIKSVYKTYARTQ